MSHLSIHPFSSGVFLITPLSDTNGNDQFTALLSIRRGKGSQTHDRVYTFKPEFKTKNDALRYAAERGRHWLVNPSSLT
jgi:hypothetical protein